MKISFSISFYSLYINVTWYFVPPANSELDVRSILQFSLIPNWSCSKAIMRIQKRIIIYTIHFSWIPNINVYLKALLNMHWGVGYHKVGTAQLLNFLYWFIIIIIYFADVEIRTSVLGVCSPYVILPSTFYIN